MRYFELTLQLDHESMPDEVFPFATRFYLAPLAPKDHADKGIMIGSETGTCITLPAVFSEFRKTRRLHEIPTEELFLRPIAIIDIPKKSREVVTEQDVKEALSSTPLNEGDGIIVRTGWGDKGLYDKRGNGYILESPHFSPQAANHLASKMTQNGSNLLLTDMAMVGLPDKHLIPEWCSIRPIPPPYPSPEARTYIHLYTPEKAKADFAVELVLAKSDIMTVKKLVHCGAVTAKRVKVIVSPLNIVRGVASTCRVIAVQED